MYCTACNLEYSDELKFCCNCGQGLVQALGEAVAESLCCTRCGARLQRGEKSCQHCGARTKTVGQETVTGSCCHCGTYWRSSWLFCKRCGLDRDRALQLGAASLGKTSTASAAVARELRSAVANLQCKYCGAETPPHSHFCENCGMRLAEKGNGVKPPPTVSAIEVADPLATTIEEDEPLLSVKDLSGATVFNLDQPSKKSTPLHVVPPSPSVNPTSGDNAKGDAAVDETVDDRQTPSRVIERQRVTTAFPPPGKPPAKSSGNSSGEQLKNLRQSLREGTLGAGQAEPSPLSADSSNAAEAAQTGLPTRQQRTRWAIWMIMFAIALLTFLVTVVWRSTKRVRKEPATLQVENPALPASSVAASPVSTDLPQRMEVPAGMVLIPGGVFEMGRDASDEYERPPHFVEVRPFYLDRTEVTNDQYKAFVETTGHVAPQHWRGNQPPAGEGNHPVVNVSWQDANAYAEWVGKRLPTEEEWEFAARGSDGRLYPWGSDWNQDFANTAESNAGAIVEVGRYPGGASPFGVLDLCGNVWEWTASDLRSYQTQAILVADRKVIRGGAYDVRNDRATTTYRGAVQADKFYPKTGFRCAREVQ